MIKFHERSVTFLKVKLCSKTFINVALLVPIMADNFRLIKLKKSKKIQFY